jgi:hypothetical protein
VDLAFRITQLECGSGCVSVSLIHHEDSLRMSVVVTTMRLVLNVSILREVSVCIEVDQSLWPEELAAA